ncbi:2-dehydro-3-deoxy-D-gluconate 5-dehydrogenase KduD [Catenovulum maritimum]|uniref:3-ketoacyl-ACP reductase n=1 Tax=Catenovulum maritimum TaxID=1513271 RepID=A0A0J8GLS3_9ALTE|nr:2-dehydro-3-deoxy-D-gluconate 5-dehydrogenase KduD [Catenovulum maritimum]KMT63745.1 3-ketoacyl-ACP reductase [Catenovulum maritimum]
MSNNDLFDLTGKTALVTGASRGLGQAIAVGLATAGADVICSSSSENGCAETVEKIKALGRNATSIAANLDDSDSVRQLAESSIAWQGKLDVLVNNGGTIARHPAVDFPEDEWMKVINVNLNSAFLLSRLVGKHMIAQGQGKIINIASMLSYSGGITVPAYTASKHGIAGVTKALANEWAINNIQVNAIAPGYFRTDNTQALQDNPERNADIQKRIPAGEWGLPSQLSGAAVFLASTASDYVNGHILAVDGGWLAR